MAAAYSPPQSPEPGPSSPVDPPTEEDILELFQAFESWLKVPIGSVRTYECQNLDKTVFENWNQIAELFRQYYADVGRNLVAEVITYGNRTQKKARMIILMRKDTRRNKDEIDCAAILTAALSCLTQVFIAIANEFDTVGFDQDLYDSFSKLWFIILNDILSSMFEVDVNAACAMLDVVGAIGSDIFSQLPDRDQKRLIVFLLGHARDKDRSAQIKAKIGRCLAKFIEYSSLRDDSNFFIDVFDVTAKSLTNGESAVKIAYAWTFGNLTDALISGYVSPKLTDKSVTFVRMLLETALKCTQVPPRGRYSACRACGNVFRWLKHEMLQVMEHRAIVAQIATFLLGLVGNGIDYKLRWNAAHALGNALENNIFFQVSNSTVVNPIIKTLAKWSAQSQNYKERTQCITSLMKAKTRDIYGPLYPYVWDRICLCISRLPVEDCESVDKFKHETVLMIFHLLAMVTYEDLIPIESTITSNLEIVVAMVADNYEDIPLERLDEALAAVDNLKSLMIRTEDSCVRRDCVSMLIDIVEPARLSPRSPI